MTDSSLQARVSSLSLLQKRRARRDLPPPASRRAIRVDAGASQADVAAVLGVHRETVSRWERGERTPRGDLLIGYVKLLRQLASPADDEAAQ